MSIVLQKKTPKRRFRRLDRLLMSKLREKPDESLSFFSSFAVHLILLLLLALLTRTMVAPSRHITLLPTDGESTNESSFMISEGTLDTVLDQELSSIDDLVSTQDQRIPEIADVSKLTTDRSIDTDLLDVRLTTSTKSVTYPVSSSSSSMFLETSLEGREPSQRRAIALQNGGSIASEKAVDDALEWFAKHQLPDGSWSTEMSSAPCNGRCQHGTIEQGRPKKVAATGLALLCFLGAGETHKKGKYQETVYAGLAYLTNGIKDGNRKNLTSSGRLAEQGASYEMYEQGIATLALCEAYQMTGDSMIRGPLEMCVDYIQRCQHANGSWGYHPNEAGDLSIVGWQIMALKSATRIGLKVKPETIRRADKFLDSQQSGNGAFYGYRGTEKEACTTAIGLLLRLYRGWVRTDPRMIEGAQYILNLGPSSDGIYYNYYATQFLFHLKLDRWAEWNTICRDYLISEQSQAGHEKGSWYFGRNSFNKVGGRLYNTAMATLSLEVYYRNMPIYAELSGDSFSL